MPVEAQHYWLSGAVDIAGHIAFLADKQRGKCIWDWYFLDSTEQKALILGSMEKYPNSTPTGIILALSERTCGPYPRQK